jgi:hypothetical protein
MDIKYTKRNIDVSTKHKAVFEQLKFDVVPTLVTHDFAILGFHTKEVNKLIKNLRL